MTSPILAPSPRNCCRRDGFTLAEILTVIGILGVLIGILIPVITSARRTARRTAIQADLQTIATAINAYKSDHGDIPRPAAGVSGANALMLALIAPRPEAEDGADGPGFRLRGTQGRVYGPYIPAETFPLADPDEQDPDFSTHMAPAHLEHLTMMPRGDNVIRPGASGVPYWSPILYFPARTGKRNLALPNAYIDAGGTAMFDFDQNDEFFQNNDTSKDPSPMTRMRFVLGDVNDNGAIDAGETARFEGEYILWHPGFDAEYGPATASQADLNKMDDVTNFYP